MGGGGYVSVRAQHGIAGSLCMQGDPMVGPGSFFGFSVAYQAASFSLDYSQQHCLGNKTCLPPFLQYEIVRP